MLVSDIISQRGARLILVLMTNPHRFPSPDQASFGLMLIAILGLISHVNGVSANKYPGAVLSFAFVLRPKLNLSALQSGAPLNGLVSITFRILASLLRHHLSTNLLVDDLEEHWRCYSYKN